MQVRSWMPWGLALCLWVVAAPMATAQEDPAKPDDPEATTAADDDQKGKGEAKAAGADASDETAGGAASAEASAEDPAIGTLEQLIYLPFKDLKAVFNNQDASVVVPYSEYIRLWEHFVDRNRGPTSKPSVNAVITESAYKAVVEKDVVRIGATYAIQVLDDGWAEVPLQFGDAAIGRVSNQAGGVLMRGTGNGTYSILLSEPGTHNIRVELVTRVHSSPEGRTFSLKIPTVGVTTLELTVPESDQTVEISPRSIVMPSTGDAGTTSVKASIGASDHITAKWNPRAGLKPEMNLLASVTNHLHVTIDEGLVHTSARLHFDVLRGELNQLRVAVPLGDRILDVSAPGSKIRGWRAEEAENHQVLSIELLAGVEDGIDIEVHSERSAPDGGIEVVGLDAAGSAAGIHALEVVRENGFVIVTHAPELSVTVNQQQGLSRVNAGEVDRRYHHDHSLYYRFYSPATRLNLSVRPVDPRVMVDHTAKLAFRDDELRMDSVLEYHIDRAGVFELVIGVPEEVTVDNVTADGMSEFTVSDADRKITVSLTEKRQGDLTVRVIAHRDFNAQADETQLELPLLAPEGVMRENGVIQVYTPPAIEVITDQDNLTGVHPVGGLEGTSWNRAALISAWGFSRRPVSLPVRTLRKPTRLAARVGTTINVEPELARVSTRLVFETRNAGIDTFRFSVPEAVADSVRIESVTSGAGSPAIKQRSREDQAADGQVTWSIVLQDDMLGTYAFDIDYDLQLDGQLDKGSAQVTLDPLRVLPPFEDEARAGRVTLAQTTGEIAVHRDRALSVSAEVNGDDIEPIDVRELTLLSGEGALAYRYYKQPVSVVITAEKHEIQKIVQTVISRALVEAVLERDPTASFLCRYRITSSERQRLPVYLPAGVEMHEPLVDGRKTVLESNSDAPAKDGYDAFYVNVARTSNSDQAFVLTLHYRAPVAAAGNRPFSGRGGRQVLQFPVIAELSGAVTQQLRTVVHVPKDYVLVGTPDQFVSESPSRVAGLWPLRLLRRVNVDSLHRWIGGASGGMVDFPRAGHSYQYSSLTGAEQIELTWWDMPFVVWILSGAVFLCGYVIRQNPWESKMGVVLMLAFVLALFGLRESDYATHTLAAASYGIIGVALLWAIHLVFGRRGSDKSGGGSIGAPPPDTSRPSDSGGASSGTAAAAVVPPPGAFDMVDSLMGRKSNG